jgi:hypothetical protein
MNEIKFNNFKKELKKIDTPTRLRIETDKFIYSIYDTQEADIIYNLYYKDVLSSVNKIQTIQAKTTDMILELINRYEYIILKNEPRHESYNKELNMQLIMRVS